MKHTIPVFFGIVLAILAGCSNNTNDGSVVSKRYVHKYGYAVSQEEWDTHNYPGQVITTMRDGVTVTMTYEHGILHGPCTYSYPHSQIVESYMLYKNSDLVKEIRYDRHGMPIREEVFLSPTRRTITTWYTTGSPLSIEEFSGDELVEAQYFTSLNETESRVDKGTGLRICRDSYGLLLSRDSIEKGYMTKREAFYPSGAPEYVAQYYKNALEGEKKIFSENGEPLAIEEWKDDRLHGLATYFSHGVKVSEISYLYGQKNGLERHFLDGDLVSQEVVWENDKRHGPSMYFSDGYVRTEWFYDGDLISQRRFEELSKLDQMISQISPDCVR